MLPSSCLPQFSLTGDSPDSTDSSKDTEAENAMPMNTTLSLSHEHRMLGGDDSLHSPDSTRPKTAPSNRSHTTRLGDLTSKPAPLAAVPHHVSAYSARHGRSSSSIDSSSVPTQTIMKALVSRPPPN